MFKHKSLVPFLCLCFLTSVWLIDLRQVQNGERVQSFIWDNIINILNNKCNVLQVDNMPHLRDVVERQLLHMMSFISGQFISYPIPIAAKKLSKLNKINTAANTVIYLHGFNGIPDPFPVINMAKILTSKGYNFFAFNYTLYSRGFNYFGISAHTPYLAEVLADFLTELHYFGLRPEGLHMIGLSLGVHVGGIAAKIFEERHGVKIFRITGLDPAAPCFYKDSPIALKKEHATYVDIIHTSVISYSRDIIAHATYYINGKVGIQPGCIYFDIQCSHSRVLFLFWATVLIQDEFVAKRCKDIDNHDCQPWDTSLMGFGSSPKSRGIYVIKTTGLFPFAIGMAGVL